MKDAYLFSDILVICGVPDPPDIEIGRLHSGVPAVTFMAPNWRVTFICGTGELVACGVLGPGDERELVLGAPALAAGEEIGGLN